MDRERILDVLPYLPNSIKIMLEKLIMSEWPDIEEIRLRARAPLTIGIWGESCFITDMGGITNHESDAYQVSEKEVKEAFANVCENSVYAHLEEIRRGYITIKGGHRVGICGKAVCEDGKITTIKEISSLNFRIAHQIIGISDGIADIVIRGMEIVSTLVISPPQMGKTTMLRDMARQISNRGFKCGIADDRGELAAMYNGVPTNDVGAQTDVLDGVPKCDAIEMLIRTMSPKVIISDEIASEKDVSAIRMAAGTGVKVIASTHGSSLDEVLSRMIMKPVFADRVFSQAIILKRDFTTPDSVTYTEAVNL